MQNAVACSYFIICDEKARNVDSGTFTSGDWRTRDLNTEIADPDGIVSISNNQFTLSAGDYLIEASAPAFSVNQHVIRLQNITASTTVQHGQAAMLMNLLLPTGLSRSKSKPYRQHHF